MTIHVVTAAVPLVDVFASNDFFHALIDTLEPMERDWVVATISRYAQINEVPGAPQPRM